MNSWMSDPRFLAAWAVTADADPDLPRGTHLRIVPSTTLGIPLAPFSIWNVEPVEAEIAYTWRARDRRAFATPDLDAAGGELIGWPLAQPPGDSRLGGVEARFHGGAGEIALIDRTDAARVNCARSTRRWMVASPQVTFVRLRGAGPVTVRGWVISAGRSIEALLGASPIATLSAPVGDALPWYAGGEGADAALRRVADGAPRRFTAPDQPDGPFDPLTPTAEIARVNAFRARLDDELVQLLGDPLTMPSKVVTRHVFPETLMPDGRRSPFQRLSDPVLSTLLMQAMDPGAARYLGLMTTLANLPPNPDPFAPPTARGLLAAGLFACTAESRRVLPGPDAMEQRLIARLLQLQPALRDVVAVAAGIPGLRLRAFATSAIVAPPPDPIAAPNLKIGELGWQRNDEGPSTRFRAQIRVAAAPLAPLVAIARREPDGWVTRHEMMDLEDGAEATPRAAARLLGSCTTIADGRSSVINEADILADGAPWPYRVALGDLFGRFGPAAEIPVPLPDRPDIPAPVVRTHVTLRDAVPGDGPVIPGTVRCTVAVPSPSRLTAGSRALSRVIVALDGDTQSAAAPLDDSDVTFDFDLPALLPMESRVVTVTAQFEVDDVIAGPSSTTRLDVADPRSPPVPATGIGIVWSSRPSPSAEVEFRLQFTATAGARYRAYLTDARGLDLALVDGARPLTRAEIAVDGAQRGLAGVVGMRDRFRLLTEPALEAGGDGIVRFDTRLPRSLETVQFLRFVPVSARNSEAPFERCPLLPIAVPSDRRPPAPRVSTAVDAGTGVATVTVTALGLDLVALQAAEPGLFDDPAAGDAKPPEYRLRRASGSVPDALYAREIGRGVLRRDAETFVAVVEDSPTPDGLVPYVSYFYWAEVRYQPERRVPRGVLEVALPGGAIAPTWPSQREDAPAFFSAPSSPAMAMHVPTDIASLDDALVTAAVAAGANPQTFVITVAILNGPVASPRARPGFTVRLHWQAEDGPWTPVPTPAVMSGGALAATFAQPGAAPASRVALILVDPVGREAAPRVVDVAPV